MPVFIKSHFRIILKLDHRIHTPLIAATVHCTDSSFVPNPFPPWEPSTKMEVMFPIFVHPHPMWAWYFVEKRWHIHDFNFWIVYLGFDHFQETIAVKLHVVTPLQSHKSSHHSSRFSDHTRSKTCPGARSNHQTHRR